ncbi:unnamed protein product, partial [marine sediment metagenome]
PAGDGTRGDPLTDFDGSGQCYLTDNRDGNSDVDGGPTRLISPILDVSETVDPTLSYARWFTNDDLDQDRMDVEISDDDGDSWTLIESVSDTEGWIERTVTIADYVDLTAQVRVRFGVVDNPNNSVTEAGVDAVTILDITCSDFINGDFDGDGDVDLDDFVHWGGCLTGPDNGPCDAGCDVFDFDADADVDLDDFAKFQAAFTDG